MNPSLWSNCEGLFLDFALSVNSQTTEGSTLKYIMMQINFLCLSTITLFTTLWLFGLSLGKTNDFFLVHTYIHFVAYSFNRWVVNLFTKSNISMCHEKLSVQSTKMQQRKLCTESRKSDLTTLIVWACRCTQDLI